MPRVLLLIMLLTLSLTACGPSNYVRLRYDPVKNPEIITQQSPVITIIQFTDQRKKDDVGVRSDNTPFIPVDTVSVWISRALQKELTYRGYTTKYVLSPEGTHGTPHQITGEILHVWLKETCQTEYTVRIELLCSVDGEPPATFTAELTRQDFPLDTIAQDTLTEGLREILSSLLDHIAQKVNQ